MKKVSFFCAAALLLLGTFTASGAADEPAESLAFLRQARQSRGVNSYAMLDGKVQHQRRGQNRVEYPFYFGTRITPERMTAQLLIDEKEGYTVGQTLKENAADTAVVPMKEGGYAAPLLGAIGLRASDLTMSFLYYDFKKELEPAIVRLVPCRVLLLEAPDHSELAKVYISREYRFPLKAEFFHKERDAQPYRTLEIASFKQKNDLYYTDTLDLSGPGWRTRIDFDRADVGVPDPAKPPALFRAPKGAPTP